MFNNICSYSDLENLFINDGFTCYGCINPLFSVYMINKDALNSSSSIFFNHKVRYRSFDTYNNIVSMIVFNRFMWHTYSSFSFVLNHVVEDVTTSFLKAIIVNRYNFLYGRIIIIFPSLSSFSFSPHFNRIYQSFFSGSVSMDIETNIRRISEILWQNSNSTNGLYIPILSLVMSFLAFTIAVSVSPSLLIDKPYRLLLAVIITFSSIFIILLLIRFFSRRILKSNIRIWKYNK